jgi:DNA-binding transcriptional MerR regulator
MAVREGPVEWPALERYSDSPMFNTGAVVQQTGVPAPTLRAWERRYTLISPERARNTYRLYSERDIALIRWLKHRIDSGMSISHAIALFRHLSEAQEHQEQQEAQLPRTPAVLGDSPAAFQIAFNPPLPEPSQEMPASYRDAPPSSLHQWPRFATENPLSGPASVYNMRVVRDQIIEAFEHFNEQLAHTMLNSMLALYSVEQVCTELIAPTMWRIGQLWAEGQLSVPVEHFASNFFRALLSNLLRVTPDPCRGSLTLVCCAPGEPHELGALMLALLLRRRSLCVAYLGQSIETAGLLHVIRQLTPALVCVSLTMPAYLPALINLGRQVQKVAHPRPELVFGGQVFAQYANIIPQIPGTYLDGDLNEIAERLQHMALEQCGPKN